MCALLAGCFLNWWEWAEGKKQAKATASHHVESTKGVVVGQQRAPSLGDEGGMGAGTEGKAIQDLLGREEPGGEKLHDWEVLGLDDWISKGG